MNKIFLMLCVVGLSCNKANTGSGYEVYKVPHSLFIWPQKDGIRLSDSIIKNMKISYIDQGQLKYLSDFVPAIDGFDTLGILTTRDIGFVSGDDGIKNYLLEYPDGTTEDLFVDYRYLSEAEAKKDPCTCHYPFRSIKYKGKTLTRDTSYSSIGVTNLYILERN